MLYLAENQKGVNTAEALQQNNRTIAGKSSALVLHMSTSTCSVLHRGKEQDRSCLVCRAALAPRVRQ